MRALATALVAVGLLAGAIATPAAWAGTYEVHVCSQIGAGDGLVFSQGPNSVGFESEFTCGNPGRFGGKLNLHADSQTNMRGSAQWTLRAPAETAIRSLEATRLAIPSWSPRTLVWEVKNSRGTELDSVASPAAETSVKYNANSTSLTIGMRCTRNVCQTGDSGPGVSLDGMIATMEENRPPVASVFATPELQGTVKGTVTIPFRATDQGSGVRLSALIVDGAASASAEDANDGRCVAPFRFLAPCKLVIDSSFALDTRNLKNGRHLVHVVAVDASGLETTSVDIPLNVDNTPPPADPPKNPSPPAVPPVTPNPPTPAPPIKLPPALSGVSLSRTSFKAGKRTLLRFTSSEAGTLSIAISPAGRKSAKPLATITRRIGAGAGSFPIVPKAKGKLLRPGRYRLDVKVRDADGDVSGPASLRLTIARG